MQSSEAKRHHYIPEMVLSSFTDPYRKIWFNRQGFPAGLAKHTSISNIFAQGQLYTFTNNDGTKDRSLESFFSDQESKGASFIKQFAEVVRRNEIPRNA